ncbi:MAG: c-type cytochrome [Acidimicrobiales bacterium]|nr:c-type cytochrome [Acidimicrobiales bacterium]
MTEVPDYLLERSRARRAAIQGGDEGESGGGGDSGDSGSAAPAKSEAAAPAAASMPAHPEPVEDPPPPPPSPMVQAHEQRRKIPFWALPVVVMIPIWAYVYVGTLSPPPDEDGGAAALGEEIYGTQCAGCHGSGGGGGSGPAFTNGAIYETWPSFEDHFEWVRLGSNGWVEEYGDTYGATDKPVLTGMPGFTEDQLSDADLVFATLYERELGGENPDPEDAGRLQVVADLMFENEEMTLDEAIETAESEGLFEAAAGG